MNGKISLARVFLILAIISAAILTGCNSGDVIITGRLVENGEGLANMWIVLADYKESDDGYTGYQIRFDISGEPEHPWAETGSDGSWQISITADEAKGFGSTLLVVMQAGQVTSSQAMKKNGSPLQWGPGRLRGTISLGDIQYNKLGY